MKAEDRDPVDFLNDILDSIDKIGCFIEGLDFDEFSADEKTVYAVTRALEIIGEATKNLPESLKKKYSEVPWRKMTAKQDRVYSRFFGEDLSLTTTSKVCHYSKI